MAAAVVQAEGLLGHGQVEGERVGTHGVVDRQPPDALHNQLTFSIMASMCSLCQAQIIRLFSVRLGQLYQQGQALLVACKVCSRMSSGFRPSA